MSNTALDGAARVGQLDTLNELHDRYLADIRRLDKLGEPLIAAHLIAAVDALEARLMAAGRPVAARREFLTAAIVHGLRDRLGDRAIIVAKRQLEGAQGDAATAWAAIVDQLDGR